MRQAKVLLSVMIALSLGLVAPSASALTFSDDGEVDTPIVAPDEDGTGGANDTPEEEPAPDTIISEDGSESWETSGDAPPPPEGCAVGDGPTSEVGTRCIEPRCDPYSVWYKVTSSTKSGKVTRWDRHYKNDSTRETFTWSVSNSATVKATVDTHGTIGGEAALKKVAKVTLGGGTAYGLEGQIASKKFYQRKVTFTKPGKWVIYRGVASGSGSVSRYKCSGNGQKYSRTGGASASTFSKATVTGLINCANSVSGYVPRAAKSKCG